MRTRNVWLPVVVLLLIASWVVKPASTQGQVNAGELKKFQGKWKLVSAEMDGTKVKDEHVNKSMMSVQGTSVRLFVPHQHKDTIASEFTRIDPAADPHLMSWMRSNGPNAGKTMPAIYRFESPDILQVCFDPTLQKQPEKFGTAAGSGHIWQTWKRVK